MKIVLIGDSHGSYSFISHAGVIARSVGAEHVIQLGDFCFCNERDLDALSGICKQYGVELWWIDGNHDNPDLMASVGVSCDDTEASYIADGVRYLPRGYRFELGGRTFLSCGGAFSISNRTSVPYIHRWPTETVTSKQILRCGTEPVDVLLTHDAPWGVYTLESMLEDWDTVLPDSDVRASRSNRSAISAIVEATEPKLVAHGHYHTFYREFHRNRNIFGLAHYAAAYGNVCVLDTETLEVDFEVA